jgi:hypothetical protein
MYDIRYFAEALLNESLGHKLPSKIHESSLDDELSSGNVSVQKDFRTKKEYLSFDSYLGGTDINMTHLCGTLEDGKLQVWLEYGDRASNTYIQTEKAGQKYTKYVKDAFDKYIKDNNYKTKEEATVKSGTSKIQESRIRGLTEEDTKHSNSNNTKKEGNGIVEVIDSYGYVSFNVFNKGEKECIAKKVAKEFFVKANHHTNKGLVTGFVKITKLETLLDLAKIYIYGIGGASFPKKELEQFFNTK